MDWTADPCREGVQARWPGRAGKTNQVRCAPAIRGAKTWDDKVGSRQLQRSACPITFTASCASHCPHLRNACPPCVEQIVYVPVKAFLGAKMALQSFL